MFSLSHSIAIDHARINFKTLQAYAQKVKACARIGIMIMTGSSEQ